LLANVGFRSEFSDPRAARGDRSIRAAAKALPRWRSATACAIQGPQRMPDRGEDMSEPESQSLVPTETADRRAAGADPKLLEILVCPLTRATLSYDAERQELISRAAKRAYPIRDGIPIMLPEEARRLED
jgi:hypothetical protein